ncbi:hypothetical protein BJF90_04455 [Pseudonocardia sp. CNS-004]|nr:hypothetical protein BJF90_04455 [Pseudonocardia sp. CNS-004]
MTIRLADNFASHFEHIADLAPDRQAVVVGDRELTWARFDEQADRLAGHLAARGVGAGDRVALDARNSPEYVVALHALYKLMALPVNVNYRYRATEVRYLLESSAARAVIVDDDLADVVAEAAQELPGCDLLVRIGKDGGFGPEVAAADRHPRRPRGDTEWRLYTGGTTGYPKAVLGSHTERLRSVRSGGFATLGLAGVDEVEALHQALDIDPHGPRGMVQLPASPLMHGTGLYSALGALSVGAPLVLLAGTGITGAGLLAAIARHRVTDLVIVGDAFGLRLLDALDEAAAAGRAPGIGSLRRIRSIGSVWSPGVKRRLLAHADVALSDTIASAEGGVYARSETTRASLAEAGGDDETGTFELAPGARLLDEDGHDVVPGSGVVGTLAAPVVPEAPTTATRRGRRARSATSTASGTRCRATSRHWAPTGGCGCSGGAVRWSTPAARRCSPTRWSSSCAPTPPCATPWCSVSRTPTSATPSPRWCRCRVAPTPGRTSSPPSWEPGSPGTRSPAGSSSCPRCSGSTPARPTWGGRAAGSRPRRRRARREPTPPVSRHP